MDIKIIEIPQDQQEHIVDELERALGEFVEAGQYDSVVMRELINLYNQDKPMPNSAVMLLHMCIDDPDKILVIKDPTQTMGGEDDDEEYVVDMVGGGVDSEETHSSDDDKSPADSEIDGDDYDNIICDGGREQDKSCISVCDGGHERDKHDMFADAKTVVSGRERKSIKKISTSETKMVTKTFDGVRINPIFAKVMFDGSRRIRNYGGQIIVIGVAHIESQPYYYIKYGIGGSVAPAEVLLSGSFGPEYYLRLVGSPVAAVCKPGGDVKEGKMHLSTYSGDVGLVRVLQNWFSMPKPGAYIMQIAQSTIQKLDEHLNGELPAVEVVPDVAKPSIFADQLTKLQLPDRPLEMGKYFGVEKLMRAALLTGKWNAEIGEIIERKRQLMQQRGTDYRANIQLLLRKTLTDYIADRLFGRNDSLTAKQTKMVDDEVERTLKQIAGHQVPKWASALAKFNSGQADTQNMTALSDYFANYNLKTGILTDPGVDDRWIGDWIRDSEGVPIICPHIWYRRRYGETMRTFETLQAKFAVHKAQADFVVDGLYCKLCGELIARDDSVDYQSFERLEPDREQKDLVYRFTLLAKTWLDFKGGQAGAGIESTSFRRIISGACGAISPIAQDVRKNLRKVRTLSDVEFEQLYDFYTGVIVFAMFVLLIRDNKTRIFIRPVREKFVYKERTVETGDRLETVETAEVVKDADDNLPIEEVVADQAKVDDAANLAEVVTQPDVAEEIDSDLIEDMDGAGELGEWVEDMGGAGELGEWVEDVDQVNTDTSLGDQTNADVVNHTIGVNTQTMGEDEPIISLVDARTLESIMVGGAQSSPTALAAVHKWAVSAIQQQYRETILTMPDLTKDVIINRLNNAFAKLSTVVSSAMLVKTEYVVSSYTDEVSEKLAKYKQVDLRKASVEVIEVLDILRSARNGKFMRKTTATPAGELDIGGLGTVMIKREPPAARTLDKGDKLTLSFMYGLEVDAANAKLLASNAELNIQKVVSGSHKIPHIHVWNIYKVRRGGKFEYVKVPGGSTIIDRYCSICYADWSHGDDSGSELFDRYYEADSFFNYYTSNCPVFNDGHHYQGVKSSGDKGAGDKGAGDKGVLASGADAECKCGISRNKLARRNVDYYSKYIAEFKKYYDRKVEIGLTMASAVEVDIKSDRGDKVGDWSEIDVKSFVAQTYVAYSAVHTKIKQDQYANIFTDLGLSSACTWNEFISGKARAVISGEVVSEAAKQRRVFKTESFGVAELTQLNKYAQLALVAGVMLANYRNLAKQDPDIIAIGEKVDKAYKPPVYQGKTLIELRRSTAEAAMPAMLRNYTLWMIAETAKRVGKATSSAWIVYIVGKIVEMERGWALLSEEELATLKAKDVVQVGPQVAIINSADNEIVTKLTRKDLEAADAENDEENIYDGMDYDGENENND